MSQTKDYTGAYLRQKEIQEQEQRQFEKLNNRFNGHNKPWHLRNKGKRIYALIFSYVFNLISLLGLGWAFTLGFELFGLQNKYIGFLLAIPIMLLFEKAKRYFSDAFWDYYHAAKERTEDFIERISWSNAIMNFIVLFGISMAASVGGNYFMTLDNSPEAKYLGLGDDPNASALLAEVEQKKAAYQAFIEDPNNHNSKGVFYYKLLGQKDKMLSEIQAKEKLLNDQYGMVIVENEEIKDAWKLRTDFRIYFVLILTLLSEIFFEICMSFMSRYDFEVFKMQALQRAVNTQKVHSTVPRTDLSFNIDDPVLNHDKRTIVNGFQGTHTQTHTQPETRVARGTQYTQHTHTAKDTHTTHSKKTMRSASYYPGIVKRLRERWARSHEDHPRAPKSGSTRASLKELAQENWDRIKKCWL